MLAGELLPEALASFVNALLVVVAALFPVLNPLGLAPLFLSYTGTVASRTRHLLALRVALYSFVLAVAVLFLGAHVLSFFGVSLPAVQIGGGMALALTGWRILNRGTDETHQQPAEANHEVALRSAFYPLTLPLTIGPGSIAVLLTLSSNAPPADAAHEYLLPAGAGALLGLAGICVAIYFCYSYAEPILRRLGETGVNVMLRLSAFLLMCIGVQILINGLRALRVMP
jgi:multiple antibiotic resistance protein